MRCLKRILFRVSGNRLVQRLLERNVEVSQYLMGIGSGSGALTSGEEAVFELLKQKVDPPYCVFDVGANRGQFFELILQHIPVEDCFIHCFEPGRSTFEILSRTLGSDPRRKLNNFGLGRQEGEVLLHYDSAGSGLASLTKRRLKHFNIGFDQAETVRVRTIDHYCAEHAIAHIHLLKIDIEGHELDALAGAERMFAEEAIDIVTFEFGGCNIDTRTFFQDFWYFFGELGFDVFRMTPSGFCVPIGTYREVHEQFRTMNYIAVSRRLRGRASGSH